MLQWEADVILREESWEFSSHHTVDTQLVHITKQMEHSEVDAEGKKLVVQVHGNQIIIKKRSQPLLRACGIGTSLFSGTILPTSSGSRIHGRFGMPRFSRIVSLMAINAFGVWGLLILSLCVYQGLILGDLTFTQAKTSNVFLTGLFGIAMSWCGYKFFGFWKYFEHGNRQTIESFLRKVTN